MKTVRTSRNRYLLVSWVTDSVTTNKGMKIEELVQKVEKIIFMIIVFINNFVGVKPARSKRRNHAKGTRGLRRAK